MEAFLQQVGVWLVPVSAVVTIGTLILYITNLTKTAKENRNHEIDLKVDKLLHFEVKKKLKEYGIVEGKDVAELKDREFNRDPEVGLIEIFRYFSSNALPFIGYHHQMSSKEPIFFDKRLFDDENMRFLKNIDGTDPTDLYREKTVNFKNIVKDIDSQLSKLHQGVTERIIFDLEHGGIFYYRISLHEYIVGVCVKSR